MDQPDHPPIITAITRPLPNIQVNAGMKTKKVTIRKMEFSPGFAVIFDYFWLYLKLENIRMMKDNF